MPNTISEPREPASPGAADAPSTKRRLATQHVREARDRLTSTSGTRPVFDYELLRQFAQNRLSGSLVILLLVLTIGLLSSLWTGALTSGVWTGGAGAPPAAATAPGPGESPAPGAGTALGRSGRRQCRVRLAGGRGAHIH